MSDVKGEKACYDMRPKDADKLMRAGITVQSVDGENVTMTEEVPDHWLGLDGTTPKSKKERIKRATRLANALRAVVMPHEIWEHHGMKIYVRKYEDNKYGGYVMAGVIKDGNTFRTYYSDKPEKMEKSCRQGKLLYLREEKLAQPESSTGSPT